MSERSTAKAKRRDNAKASERPPGPASLGEENARLKAELAAARQRIVDLETKHAEVVNRIDWVIDSLHNLPD
jgi:hypothetical protein